MSKFLLQNYVFMEQLDKYNFLEDKKKIIRNVK